MSDLNTNLKNIKSGTIDFSDLIDHSDDRIVNFLLKEAFVATHGPKGGRSERNEFALLLLAAIVGTEPFKILLRKNIGRYSISPVRLALACCVYFYWGGMMIFFIHSNELGTGFPFWTNKSLLLPIAVFYFLLGLFTSIAGIVEYRKANAKLKASNNNRDIEEHLYRGDSVFFGDSITRKSNPGKIWMKEAWFCLVLSLLLTVLNPFLGGLLLLTSISFLINEWIQIDDVWGVYKKRLEKAKQKTLHMQGRTPVSDEDFSPVTLN